MFLLFLGSLLLAYQWKANNVVKAAGRRWWCCCWCMPDVGRLNGSYFDLAIQMCIFAALALGLNIVVGQAGLLDLGYVAFFAVGAYVWGIFGSGQFQQIVQSDLPYTRMGVGDWLIPLILALLGVVRLPVAQVDRPGTPRRDEAAGRTAGRAILRASC